MDVVVFWVAAAVTVIAAVNLIFQRKPINSVLSLVVVLFALAVLYLQLSAELVAILQIILYAGAIMVLFLFVVMLLNLQRDEFGQDPKPSLRSAGVLLGGVIIIEISLMARAFLSGDRVLAQEVSKDFGSVAQVGQLLFTKFILPFELTSILLLIAVAGALILASHRGAGTEGEIE